MNKKLLLLVLPATILCSCGTKQTTLKDIAFSTLKNFTLKDYDGFDLKLSQTYATQEVNSIESSLRIKKEKKGYIGYKHVFITELQEFNPDEQFKTTSQYYFYDVDKLLTLEDDHYVKEKYDFNDFIKCDINKLNFNDNTILRYSELASDNEYRFSCMVPKDKSEAFYKKINFNKLKIEASFSLDAKILNSITFEFLQDATKTIATFKTYKGEVDINLPN